MSDKIGFFRLDPSKVTQLDLVKTKFIKPEWIDTGRADEKGHVFYNNDERNVQVGFWECTPFSERVTFPYDELGIIVSGKLEIVDGEGRSEIFTPGEIFYIPRGQTVTWNIMETLQQYYMIYAPRDDQYMKF